MAKSHKREVAIILDPCGFDLMIGKVIYRNMSDGDVSEIGGDTSNKKWIPAHFSLSMVGMHVSIVKTSDVPDFTMCERAQFLINYLLAIQATFKG